MADKDTQEQINTENTEQPTEEVVESVDETAGDTSEVTTEEVEEAVPEAPRFRVGDTVRVQYRIVEGEKSRVQPYEGIVISKKGRGMSKTFTVRRIGADNIGVERIFPLYSPNLQEVEILKHGKPRRAKLYYLRHKKGRAATKIKERKVKTGV